MAGPGIDPLHRSAVAEQLQHGFPWLRFEDVLEGEYQRDHFQQSLVQLRLNLVLGIGLVLAFVAMDRMVLPTASTLLTVLRYAVVLPSLAVCLGVTFIPHGWRIYRWTIAVIGPLLALAITAIVLNIGTPGEQEVFPVLVLAAIFIYYLAGLSFYAALRTNLIGLAAFVIGASLVDVPGPQAAYQAMVLFFANLVGATVAYNLEMARRTGWLESRLLAEMAERDGLTGTYNRRRLDSHLRRAWQLGIREQCPMALLMIDIDCFKAYNDSYGHQAGDEALKAVAGVLSGAARRPLDFVARYGGEEFLIVLYDTTRQYASDMAQQTLDGVRRLRIPHSRSTAGSVLTVSIGVAYVKPVAGRSVEGFLQLADEALYAAKNSGRNRVHVMEAEYEQLRTGTFRVAPR